ncbi:MAG TPA: methyltransferase domain-containing protein [Thermoleophilaceae bacterium]|nr:methyltransferase domain-containing protein [Thermoleophilaceae bacterium]
METWRYREQFEIEDRHWWFRSRRAVVRSLLSRAGVPPSPRILDAGCGTGANLREYERLGKVTGVDPFPEAIELCRERGLDNVVQARAEKLPFGPGSFELLFATDVIEHLDDDIVALRELRRVAADGARLVLTVPAYGWLWSDHDVSVHHRRRYTVERLRRSVRAAGWEPALDTYFFTTALPAVALVRTLKRARSNGDARSDLSLPPAPVNRLLELPTLAEAKAIERGARLPAGVSVGMVCVAG